MMTEKNTERRILVPAKKTRENPILKEILLRVSGTHGYEVANALIDQELTDEELAKKTGIRLNLVRRILYDLYENRIVNYRRVRDENTGWYIYYWHLEPERAISLYHTNQKLFLKKLEERLEHEKNTMFFSCKNSCPKVPFDEAAENDFKCPKCGKKLEYFDNSEIIAALERQIEALKQNLAGN
jgi:transcription initiation factor TFIIE subunit alpha